MSLTRVKTWADGEQLTAADLNAEFDNLTDNALNAATQTEVNNGSSNTVALTPLSNLIVLGTLAASTSGTSVSFSSIPSGIRKIHIMFASVSTSGTSNIMVQIGDAGGLEPSGYVGSATTITTATPATANFTTGFGVTATTIAGAFLQGCVTLTLLNASSFTWTATSIMGHSNAATISIGGGSKSLSAELTQLAITTVGGADTFDNGGINISYER